MDFCRWKNIFAVFLIFIVLSVTTFSHHNFKTDDSSGEESRPGLQRMLPSQLLLRVAQDAAKIETAHILWLFESKLTIDALEKALTYFKNRPKSITGDVILGVLLAKANLEWIMDRIRVRLKRNLSLSEDLEKLIRKCDDLIELDEPQSLPILNKNFWKGAARDLKRGVLNQKSQEFALPKFDSCRSIDAYMMKGTPKNSDFCINELFSFHCKVSDGCWFSEVNGGFHSGYKTTHRLLYFQTAAQIKCETVNEKFSGSSKIREALCQQILREAKMLFRESHFPLTQDLFMEQIALCGLEGYEDFAPEIWRKEVRRLQSLEGCFGKKMDWTRCLVNVTQEDIESSERKIQKRRDTISDECHTHVTAVATSAMAFFLRCILKDAFDLP